MTVLKDKSHLLFIDSIRALAALYVMIHHAVLQYYDASTYPYKIIDNYNLSILSRSVLKFFMFGNYAVSLFIVVSGYSLMLSITKNNFSFKNGVVQFFKRRALRILPPYYFAMLFSLLLIWLFIGDKTGTHWDISIPVNLKDVIVHILLAHDFWMSTAYRINHAFWSIAVECRIYVLFPLLVWVWKKYGALSALLFSVIVAVTGAFLLYALSRSNPDIALNSPGVSPYIILFTLGMMAADLSFSNSNAAIVVRKRYHKLSPWSSILAVLLFSLLGGALKLFFRISDNSFFKELFLETKLRDVLLGVVFALVLFICSESGKNGNKFFLNKVLSWRPLVFIGTFSYSLYLIHSPLVAIISKYIVTPLNSDKFESVGLLVVIGAPIIITVSYAFFYVFERPFLTMGKKASSVAIEKETIINPAP